MQKAISKVNKTVSTGRMNVRLIKGDECKIQKVVELFPNLFEIEKDNDEIIETSETEKIEESDQQSNEVYENLEQIDHLSAPVFEPFKWDFMEKIKSIFSK